MSGPSRPDTGIVPLLHACLRTQWDGNSLFLTGLCSLFVSVVHLLSHTLTSAIDADYEGICVNPGKDSVELISRESWHIAGLERLVSMSGIALPWEPGGTVCPRGVSLGGTLSCCGSSICEAKGSCDKLFDLRTWFVLLWDGGGDVKSIVYPVLATPSFIRYVIMAPTGWSGVSGSMPVSSYSACLNGATCLPKNSG